MTINRILRHSVLCTVSIAAITLTYSSVFAISDKKQQSSDYSVPVPKKCRNKQNCLTNKDCSCYCSEKGDFREKTDDDAPVWVKDDKNKKYCYCKQWDLDNYPKAKRPKQVKR